MNQNITATTVATIPPRIAGFGVRHDASTSPYARFFNGQTWEVTPGGGLPTKASSVAQGARDFATRLNRKATIVQRMGKVYIQALDIVNTVPTDLDGLARPVQE